MNSLLLAEHEISSDNTATLQTPDARFMHIKNVLKSEQGQSLNIGQINGLLGTGVIAELNKTKAVIVCEFDKTPPKKLPLTIVLALPRPKMLKRILRNIAECGVSELHLIHSYKVEKSYWQTPVLSDEKIERYLLEGLSQAKDTVLPSVHQHRLFKPFTEDILPTLCQGKEAFIAHPYQAMPCPSPSTEPRLIVIGPEGGFIDYEVNLLQQQGLQTIEMGPRIYKVETAVTLLTSMLSF